MKGKLVLVVEDDPGCALVLTLVLERCDLQAEVARNGAEGLEMMRARRPDLVLLDMLMPVMGGEEVLAAMQAEPALAQIPVILVTTVEGPADSEGAALPHIRKPFSPAEVRRTIREVLGGCDDGD